MKLSNNQLLLITIIFVLYSVFITFALGIKKVYEPLNIEEYEAGKYIGQRAKTEYLIESGQLKTPVKVDFIRIKAIEDSLELTYRINKK